MDFSEPRRPQLRPMIRRYGLSTAAIIKNQVDYSASDGIACLHGEPRHMCESTVHDSHLRKDP